MQFRRSEGAPAAATAGYPLAAEFVELVDRAILTDR
jgi:hypothetical protein